MLTQTSFVRPDTEVDERMNTEDSKNEEEELFVDAVTSPEAEPTPRLRRSTRKRKSLAEELDDTRTPQAGKRHRPLGKMGGVQRSPDGKKNSTPNPNGPRPTTSKAALTIQADPPTSSHSAEQLLLLGGIRAVLKEELGETESRLTKRMTEVESGFNNLSEEVRSLEKRVEAVERRNETRPLGGLTEDSLDTHGTMSKDTQGRAARYWKARCSLRLWPIRGEGEDLRIELQKFLTHRLRLGEDVIADTGNCSIRKIPSSKKNTKIEHEVTVEFPSVELRDVVRGAAYNLAGQDEAGIRLEIPHHLMSDFQALNSASYRIKSKFRDCKRNVKFDDSCSGLVLDFKTDAASNWRKLRPEQAREILRDDGGQAEEMSTADMSELLASGSVEDGEEEEA